MKRNERFYTIDTQKKEFGQNIALICIRIFIFIEKRYVCITYALFYLYEINDNIGSTHQFILDSNYSTDQT